MKSAGIFYFSGTGNTEIVAKMISDSFVRHEYSVDLIKIEDITKSRQKVDAEKYDLIGIGSQVIAFGCPRIVYDFLKYLPDGNGKKLFIFRTAGGVVTQNYNASRPLCRKLTRKGYDVFHERLFSIASNWAVRFDDEVVKKLYETTRMKTEIMCEQLIQNQTRFLKTGPFTRLMMSFIAAISSVALRLVGKDYKVGSSCNHCGTCIKHCPVKNIYEKNRKIKFKLSCICCMRCIYNCPKQSIKLRLFSFFYLPGGYNINKLINSPDTGNKSPNGIIPPFFNKYIVDKEL
ncbi:MAG TPA: EFR1 family ferrodoxin [Clostridia bacterium]|nr:EFR1 family ferrodoxin [Clostridia bacterium]